jgi:hypothetical protein
VISGPTRRASIHPPLPDVGSVNCIQSPLRFLTCSCAPGVAVPITVAELDGPFRIAAFDMTLSTPVGWAELSCKVFEDDDPLGAFMLEAGVLAKEGSGVLGCMDETIGI